MTRRPLRNARLNMEASSMLEFLIGTQASFMVTEMTNEVEPHNGGIVRLPELSDW